MSQTMVIAYQPSRAAAVYFACVVLAACSLAGWVLVDLFWWVSCCLLMVAGYLLALFNYFRRPSLAHHGTLVLVQGGIRVGKELDKAKDYHLRVSTQIWPDLIVLDGKLANRRQRVFVWRDTVDDQTFRQLARCAKNALNEHAKASGEQDVNRAL